MPALARGQKNTSSILNWFTTVNGVLTDMFYVGYQIWDIIAGLPGTQVFPVTPGDFCDVTANAGHFAVGSYFAWDPITGEGWQPGLAEPIGTHKIIWKWKVSSGSAYQTGEEQFEVMTESYAGPSDHYCSVQDVRDEGVTLAQASDAKILSYIDICQQLLDRMCRQWFLPRQLTFKFDGNDSDTLFLGVPIISLEYLRLNGADTDLQTDLYKVYNNRKYPDDRRNPRIKLIGPDCYRDIYVAPVTYGPMKFIKGYQNQELKGIFGFTEEDGSTPAPIKRALTKLVVEKLLMPINQSIGPSPAGPITSETTDGHSLSYGFSGGGGGLTGITNDQEVLDIVKLYKAPIGLATPASWSY